MPSCQAPGCDKSDTYPFIDPDTNKRYRLCNDHHQEARDRIGADTMTESEASDRIDSLFGSEFRDATFDSYSIDKSMFEDQNIKKKLAAKAAQMGKSFTLEDHLGQMRAARDGLEKFSRQMARSGEGTVVLGGAEGVGKTHLAAATVRRLLRTGHTAAVWHGTHLLTRIRATYGSSPSDEVASVNALMRQMLEPDVLVLEDLRESCFADDMRDYVFNIVDEVYRNQSMLVITSNYKLSELGRQDRLTVELIDRLADPPSFIQDMEGVSYRQVRKANQNDQS